MLWLFRNLIRAKVFGSKWVGLKNFRYVFDLPDIYQIIWNTFYIAILKIIMGIVIPVIVALL